MYGTGGDGAVCAPTYVAGTQQVGGYPAAVNSDLFSQYSTTPFGSPAKGLYGYSNAPLCITNPNGTTKFYASDNGQNGGQANNLILVLPTSTPSMLGMYFPHSDYSINDLHLGCGIAHGMGTPPSGGVGGGGGGKGGSGGSLLVSPFTNGSSGSYGFPGENGGDAGYNGTGGGILVLKLANSTLNFGSDTRFRFYAEGKNGHNGGTGGDGGRGGTGGIGADGTCYLGALVTPGGWGGFGEGGLGGDGADGGEGSCGGTIWILKKSGGTHSSFGNFISNPTGYGGMGGASGYTYNYVGTGIARNFDPSLSGLVCNVGEEFIFVDQPLLVHQKYVTAMRYLDI